ncbi:hypothetical protein ACIQC9_03020 [Brevundimonas sp. NPDC092305]|uniref:hypothetical protein n=1 Tax=Brevundimonas sp. NPDC092305 TaxID=3363957 RepID=UPI00382476C3
MIDRRFAEEVLERLSVAVSDILEETHPITFDAVIGGDLSREDQIAEAGDDILTLVRAMRVFRRRAGVEDWGRRHD